MQKKVRLPLHVKPGRYKIMLKPDLNEFTFSGEETIFLLLEKPANQITLHSVELEIESAEYIHSGKETWAGKISYDIKAETATLTFLKNIQKGKGKLKLTFRGILNDKMRGFYRSRYEVAGETRHMATTQFEATDARRAFPCFDDPSQKAVFDITLMVPAGKTAISNTVETYVSEHASGYQVVEFAPTPKMSTYLLAFIVGDFEYVEGRTKEGKLLRVFTTPGKKDQAKFALEVSIKCLEFYEKYFGIPYPLPVLDLIAIPDFAAGAMENWGAITYRESRLLIDEEHSSTANKQWVALVIAHELAHQWFGNLVTMEWWTNLWLNEGFASYIEFLAINDIFPEWDIWTQFVVTEMSDAFVLDSLKNTHPIEIEVSDPAEISEIFDAVSYSKGASIIRMLAEFLGEKDFRDGLRLYLKTHAYENAETQDLWQALETVSGKPVAKIMANWTSKPGHPVVRVQVTGNRLQLTQSRFFSSPISRREAKDDTVWSIPLASLRATAKQSSPEKNPTKIAASPSTSLRIPRNDKVLMDKKSILIDEPAGWIKLNAGETSLVRVDYPQALLKKLEKAIQEGQLPALDRLGLVRDSFSLAESGQSPISLALELAQHYTEEEDYTVWAELTGHISKLDSLLADEAFYEQFKSYGRNLYSNIAKKMGWEKRKSEKHTDGLLRGMVLVKLGSFGDQETIKKAQELFRKGKIGPDLRSTVYNLVAENGGVEEFNTLIKMYKEEESQQEKERIARSLGCFKHKKILQKALDFALSKHVRFQNSLQIIAFVWFNPRGKYLAWDFMKKNWDLFKERYAGGHYFTKVFPPMGGFNKKEDAKDIEKFIAKNPVPEAKRTLAQALEQIYSNAEWLKRDRKGIKNFLERLRLR